MIAWVIDFASRMVDRYPDSPDPLAEPAVVLVDEIDLHLHPKWQRELIGFLTERFPNTQFIVTAHSPLIVQAATGRQPCSAQARRRPRRHRESPGDDPGLADRSDPDQRPLRAGDRPATRHGKAHAETEGVAHQASVDQGRQKKLEEIDDQLGPIPSGETYEQAKKTMDLIEKSLELIKKYQGTKP